MSRDRVRTNSELRERLAHTWAQHGNLGIPPQQIEAGLSLPEAEQLLDTIESLQGAAWANGLERDKANERLEAIADLVREALGNVALTRSQMSQLMRIQELARPARLKVGES